MQANALRTYFYVKISHCYMTCFEDVINRWISSDKNLYRWLDGKIKIFLLCAGYYVLYKVSIKRSVTLNLGLKFSQNSL